MLPRRTSSLAEPNSLPHGPKAEVFSPGHGVEGKRDDPLNATGQHSSWAQGNHFFSVRFFLLLLPNEVCSVCFSPPGRGDRQTFTQHYDFFKVIRNLRLRLRLQIQMHVRLRITSGMQPAHFHFSKRPEISLSATCVSIVTRCNAPPLFLLLF